MFGTLPFEIRKAPLSADERRKNDEKQKEYTLKYLEKLKEIRFRVKPEEFEVYEKAAQKAGYPSMRQFYLDAIQEKVEKILN